MSEFLPTCFCGMMICGEGWCQIVKSNELKVKIQPVLKGHPWCWGWGGPSGRCTSPPDRSSSPCRWNVNIKNKPVNMCWMLIIHQAAQIVVGRQQIIALLVLHLTAPRLTWIISHFFTTSLELQFESFGCQKRDLWVFAFGSNKSLYGIKNTPKRPMEGQFYTQESRGSPPLQLCSCHTKTPQSKMNTSSFECDNIQ